MIVSSNDIFGWYYRSTDRNMHDNFLSWITLHGGKCVTENKIVPGFFTQVEISEEDYLILKLRFG
jgi:hypothetical protein